VLYESFKKFGITELAEGLQVLSHKEHAVRIGAAVRYITVRWHKSLRSAKDLK
jgi:CO/xanthine dehydrogenase FAD-binding subunit